MRDPQGAITLARTLLEVAQAAGQPVLRQRLWSDLAGKPDPKDPTKTIRPEGETLATLINAALRISQRESMVVRARRADEVRDHF